MRMSNIELIQTDNFWFDVPEKLYKHNYVRFDSIDEENAITYHYVSEDTMYNFDKKYNI